MVTKADALAELARRGVKVPTQARAMPSAALNLDNSDIDAINTGSAVNARMNPYANDLEKKKLDLGMVRNVYMDGQNFLGASSPASREFSDFRADLEKMRNDSLRLNKGVQTEGDAQRAWNELFKHMNDETLVAGRLREIQKYNDQALQFHKAKVVDRRSMYGQAPPDFTKFEVKPDAFGTSRQQQKPQAPAKNTKGMSDDDIRKALGY